MRHRSYRPGGIPQKDATYKLVLNKDKLKTVATGPLQALRNSYLQNHKSSMNTYMFVSWRVRGNVSPKVYGPLSPNSMGLEQALLPM